MDWEQTQPSAGLGPSGAAGIGNAEDPADMDTNMVVGTSLPGRRVLGRKISHRKNPSDTFAFAAGQLFQHTPEDFYNLLDAPLEYSSGAQTLQHAISANEVLVSPQTSFGGSLQHGSHAALHPAARQVSLGDLQVRVDLLMYVELFVCYSGVSSVCLCQSAARMRCYEKMSLQLLMCKAYMCHCLKPGYCCA